MIKSKSFQDGQFKIIQSNKQLIIDNFSTHHVIPLHERTNIIWRQKSGSLDSCKINGCEIKAKEQHLLQIKQLVGKQYIQKGLSCFYKQLYQIGKGGCSKIQLVQNIRDRKKYAVKVIPTDQAQNELEIWQKLNHENLNCLVDCFESKNSTFLVMELLHRTLQSDYDHEEIKLILQQILLGLQYLHQNGLMHRDLKPENIMFDEQNKVKIIDFGFTTYVDQDPLPMPRCGTPGFIAPEIFKTQHYNEKCDMFSLGAIMYQLYTKEHLMEGDDCDAVLENNRNFRKHFESLLLPHIQDEGTDLLRKLLQPIPQQRISASDALNHPYFQESDQSNIQIQNFTTKFIND